MVETIASALDCEMFLFLAMNSYNLNSFAKAVFPVKYFFNICTAAESLLFRVSEAICFTSSSKIRPVFLNFECFTLIVYVYYNKYRLIT